MNTNKPVIGTNEHYFKTCPVFSLFLLMRYRDNSVLLQCQKRSGTDSECILYDDLADISGNCHRDGDIVVGYCPVLFEQRNSEAVRFVDLKKEPLCRKKK